MQYEIEMLNVDEVPLIGFAGSPWTIFVMLLKARALRVLILPKDSVSLIQ
jgi:uroporphyrinogen-III decarboxylase